MRRVIGIDFGTSTTYMNVKRYNVRSVSVTGPDGAVRETEAFEPAEDRFSFLPVMFNFGESVGRVASIIRRNADGSFDYGEKSAERLEGSEVYTEFKMLLESEDPETAELARELVRQFFRFLFESYQQQANSLGQPDDEVQTRISYPVKWKPETAAFMIETAREAGFPNVEGSDEASAALITAICRKLSTEDGVSKLLTASQSGYLLLVDMGAGTTDLVVCKYHLPSDGASGPDAFKLEMVKSWPDRDGPTFGGREIDVKLEGYVEEYLNRALIPALIPMAHGIAAMPGQAKLWKERNVSANLSAKKPITSCGYISGYSAMLSEPFPAFDCEGFETLIREPLNDFVQLLQGCLDASAAADPDFAENGADLVILTGGHSAWYFTREILCGSMADRLPHGTLRKVREEKQRIISLPNPQSTVALGLVYAPLLSNLKIDPTDEPLRPWMDYLPDPIPWDDSGIPKPPLYDNELVYREVEAFTQSYRFEIDPPGAALLSVRGSNPAKDELFRAKSFFRTVGNPPICLCGTLNLESNNGFAVCREGVYCEKWYSTRCVDWARFVIGHLSSGSGSIKIDSVSIPVGPHTFRPCLAYFQALQEHLQGCFLSGAGNP